VHKLAQAVLDYIRSHELLRAGDRVGVAVSGGADSVGLLRVMLELRQEIGLVLTVVHLNHNLRGAESDADEGFVRELAANYGLPFLSERCDVKSYTEKRKLSLEAAARQLRYQFFENLMYQRQLDKIATAHTLDDQAETVLLKLARGAGTRGLAAIYPRVVVSHQPSALGTGQRNRKLRAETADECIIRPLLGVRRKDVRGYLAEIQQSWREDSSNRDLRHTRNRIRHGILPRFERHVNPSVCETLAETAEIARGEEEYWAEETTRLLPQVWSKQDCGGSLDCKSLNAFPLALRRRLVRAAGESLGLGFEFQNVEAVLGLESEDSHASLPAGWIAVRHAGTIRFQKKTEEPSDYEYKLLVPGKVAVLEAGIEIEAVAAKGDGNCAPEQLLEGNLAAKGLVVRNWRAGDRFWPAHSKEHKKIKELLQDQHITGEEKRRWPVIASEGEIVWVAGLGVGRNFRSRDGGGISIRESPISG
jgi:tRNA(Ile)-lysidine synthase